MVEIHYNRIFLNLGNPCGEDFAVLILTLKVVADFYCIGWDHFLVHFHQCIYIKWPIPLFRFNRNLLYIANFHTLQSLFKARDDLMGTMYICEGASSHVTVHNSLILKFKGIFYLYSLSLLDTHN